jgi:hypothetical protein
MPNPFVFIAGGKQIRLDDILQARPVLLTSRLPEPALLNLCHDRHLTPIRVVDSDPQPDGRWVEVQPVHSGLSSALGAIRDDPTLTVVVRPDGVIAGVAARSRLPDLPWGSPRLPTPA